MRCPTYFFALVATVGAACGRTEAPAGPATGTHSRNVFASGNVIIQLGSNPAETWGGQVTIPDTTGPRTISGDVIVATAGCGDGTVQAGEDCDFGGQQNGSSSSCCTVDCKFA